MELEEEERNAIQEVHVFPVKVRYTIPNVYRIYNRKINVSIFSDPRSFKLMLGTYYNNQYCIIIYSSCIPLRITNPERKVIPQPSIQRVSPWLVYILGGQSSVLVKRPHGYHRDVG